MHTWADEIESAIKVVLIDIGQDVFCLGTHLLVCAQNDEKEAAPQTFRRRRGCAGRILTVCMPCQPWNHAIWHTPPRWCRHEWKS